MSILTRSNLRNLVCIIALAFAICGCKQQAHHRHNISPPTAILAAGDIAFRLGRSLQSNLIASSGDSGNSYSHVGIILPINNEWHVVHIEPKEDSFIDIIRHEPIEDFFAWEVASAGCVMRHKALTPPHREMITCYAQQLLEKKITFDHDYRASDSTSMYCTELVERIYMPTGISLSQGRHHTLPMVAEPVIMPSDIAENAELESIWRFNYEDLRPAR